MRILVTSDHYRELLLEDDITPTNLYQELTDRAIEIEVSIDEVSDWLETEQSSLQVADDFGETISIIKVETDTFPTEFVVDTSEVYYDIDDQFSQVVDCIVEVEAIDMDIGDYPYDNFTRGNDAYEKLRRWVESHPVQWHKLTYAEIAEQVKVSLSFVSKHLPACVISAKYVSSEAEYKQKREESRGYKQVKSKPNPTIAKIHEWLRANYKRWQSMTLEEISQESETSLTAVYNNLPKLLLADGFVSSMFDYNQTRKDNRGYKGKNNQSQPNYFIECV